MKTENCSQLVDAEGLVAELPCLTVEDVLILRLNRKIPYHVFGRKTIRFDPVAVKAALAKTEVKEICAA